MAAPKTSASDKEIDELFQLPLGEFTAARNALAAKLKGDGDTEAAADVKALAKPSVSAWAVNQTYWRHRKEFEDFLTSGERLRKAQASQLSGKAADVRETLDAHREALTALSKRAAEVLREAGHTAGPEMMRRVTRTLEAIASYGKVPDAPQPGRLTDDIDPPGFDVLASLAPAEGRRAGASAPPRVLPFRNKSARQARTKKDEEEERERQIAEARAAVAEAEKTLREARRDAEQAEAALKRAAARAKKAQQEKEREEKRFEKIAATAEEASKDAHKVARQAEEAAQMVTDAERQLQRARAQLEEVE
jgi:DNA repair exonuclease SbcCD ATPase subunit